MDARADPVCLPGGDHRMTGRHFGAEESDRAQILERLRIDDRGRETVPCVAEDDEAPVGHRDGAEEPGLRVGHRLHVDGQRGRERHSRMKNMCHPKLV